MPDKSKNRQNAVDENGERSSAYFYENTASANEFTGMTPTPPIHENNAESYFDIFGVPVTSMDGGEKKKKMKKKK